MSMTSPLSPVVLSWASSRPNEDAECIEAVLFPGQWEIDPNAPVSVSDSLELETIYHNQSKCHPSTEQQEKDEVEHAITMVHREHGTMVMILRSVTTSGVASVVYTVSDRQILAKAAESSGNRIRLCSIPAGNTFRSSLGEDDAAVDYQIGELQLPSGVRILLVPTDLLQSAAGRRAVSDWLLENRAESTNGGETRSDGPSVSASSPSTVMRKRKETIVPPLPSFRTLQVALMGRAPRSEFAVNAREPVDFETELFKGKLLCILRPENPAVDDPYWNERIFQHRRRRIVINLQGKFKYQPEGTVYAGAEISKPMKLGLVTRGLAGVLLRLADRFISNVHSSFGDDTELAHIMAPAYTFFERLVITPPGQDPPALDADIEESADSLAKRKCSKGVCQWNTVDTYTFSFYSMNINLPTWSLVGLPMSGDISLTTFWGDSSVKICMYEKTGPQRQHLLESKRYVFALQVEYLGRDAEKLENDEDVDGDSGMEDILRWSGQSYSGRERLMGNSLVMQSESELFAPSQDESDAASDVELFFFDAEQPKQGFDLDQKLHTPSYAMDRLSAIDAACPAWIEVLANRSTYTKAFIVNVNGTTMLRSADDCNELLAGSTVASLVNGTFSARLSATERLRRMVGWALANSEGAGIKPTNLLLFRQRRRLFVNDFQRSSLSSISTRPKPQVLLSGAVFRALSDRHWMEELVKLTSSSILFYHPEKRKSNWHVNISSIVEIARLASDECPTISGQYFLVIKTLGRSLYLMFGSESARETFMQATLRQMVVDGGAASMTSSLDSDCTSSSLHLAQIDNPADEFLHKSSMWNCQRRRILNCGLFNFRHSSTLPNPLQLVEMALAQALEPVGGAADEIEQRRAFLDSAAKLKQADVRDLSESARLAFFLNLYHLMIMHAFLVLGPPDWSLKWISYFNNVAYEVSDDIFSLAELEHCIIRNKMSDPSQFMSRFVIPRSRYNGMALTTIDFRINFALNCGSLSNPVFVAIYKPDKLEQQLSEACRLYLQSSVSVTRKRGQRKVVVEVPRVCEWFLSDFGGYEDELLSTLEPFLSEEHRRELSKCRSCESGGWDMALISIRYQAYNYECRPLQLLPR